MKSFYLSILIFFISIFTISAQDCEKVINLAIDANYVVSWSTVSNAKSYKFEYRKSGTVEWSSIVVTDNELKFEFPEPCENYEIRVITVCENGQESESSDFITSKGDCDLCSEGSYCEVFQDNSSEFLDYFIINGVEYKTGQNSESYTKYLDNTIELAAGETYPISMAPGFNSSTYNQIMALFIDLNGNGNFEIEEALFISELTDQVVEGTITIPSEVPTGSVRLRAICSYNTFNNPCYPSSFGETEDYCVSMQSKCDADFEFEYTGLVGESANFKWNKLDGMFAFNYRYKKISETDWQYGTSIVQELKLEDLDQCTKYEIELRSVCASDTSAYRSNIQFDSFCPTAVQEIENFEFNVYPNPWANELSIQMNFDKGTEARIVAYDVLGKAYELAPYQYFRAGNQTVRIDEYQTQSMSNGLYIISVETVDQKVSSRKALKL